MSGTWTAIAVSILFLAVAAPSHADCDTHYVPFGGHGVWEYLRDNNFDEYCPGAWQFDNSSRGSTGICNYEFSTSNFTQFRTAYPLSNRTYQVVHIPASAAEEGYLPSRTWLVGFSYEKVGEGTLWDSLQLKIYDNTTGAHIWSSPLIRGSDPQNCSRRGYSFDADLNGKDLRVELKGMVRNDFSWKITGVYLQRRAS